MAPITGCDWAWGQPSDAALDQAGVRFVARYLCSDRYASKRITAAEVIRHRAAGRGIVLVWEDTASRMLSGHSGGMADARQADAQCNGIGLPGCPVYFAADWDATEAQQGLINGYLDGAADILGPARIGIYAGYWPASRAREAGLARYYWGTRAWSGGNWATCGWQPHIMQGTVTRIGGAECDWDVANFPDYGQWRGGTDWTEEAIMALPTLTEGARDDPGEIYYVSRAQALVKVIGAINRLPQAAGLTTDGAYGPLTTSAVKAVQGFFGVTADGTIGKQTWGCLIKGSPS